MENMVSSEIILENLIQRGWCFSDVEKVKGLIQINIAILGEMGTVNSIESEFLNMDLKSIGAKSLPDPSVIKKSTHLQGPKVLQIVSVRDISQSSIEGSTRNSNNHRLLRFGLTDGFSEVIAIEYSPIPSIIDDIVPGTKVRLENKAVMNNGILCLNATSVTVLGGLVQSLYDEWEMNRKYSGFSRSALRQSQKNDGDGPPPFEKLQIEARTHRFANQRNSSYPSESSSKTAVIPPMISGGKSDSRRMGKNQSPDFRTNKTEEPKTPSLTGEENLSSSESRPKEVSEAVPVQNQAASQKLLQKMNQPNQGDRYSGGRKHRGKGKQEDSEVFTLDEWERRKAGGKPLKIDALQDISHDEELARQIQNQLDLEDLPVKMAPQSEAEKIKMSMFAFEREEEVRNYGRTGPRGRGRGRGGGRGRGRGRGGGRGRGR